jgi:hypothetical protein
LFKGLNISCIRKNCKVRFYIDEQNAKEIIAFIRNEKYKSKFRRILYDLLNCPPYNSDFYSVEEVDKDTNNITAMKFKGSSGRNYRIYCKEYVVDDPMNKKIVLIKLYQKKKQKIDKRLKT